ncbi:hypothetical protein [Microbulbifer sp. SAOS-129_SWC]|uniref:hypothetical protein n=1 Tax=Microbulbifer sp. SAOS-129_SWC TaxID=3145235 RepID=UPI0032180D2F
MKTVILHVGRHKTGTSSLQSFFSVNRRVLSECGIFYPHTGVRNNAHHIVAESFSGGRVKLDQSNASPLESQLVKDLREEIASADEPIALVSSEAFQNVNPKLVAEIFSGFRLKVVMYLREQSLYLRSAYAQRVHATNMTLSLAEYYQKTFLGSSDYLTYLNRWKSIFGESLDVLSYERSALKNESIIDDFVDRYLHACAEDPRLVYPENVNPSLSETYLYYKLFLNHFIPDGMNVSGLYQRLGGLSEAAGPEDSYRLSKAMVSNVVAAHCDSNIEVASQYFGQAELFERFERPRESTARRPFPLTEEKVAEITRMLLDDLPGLQPLIGDGTAFFYGQKTRQVLKKIRDQFLADYDGPESVLKRLLKDAWSRVVRIKREYLEGRKV